jgi:hypothetical protein
MSLHLPVNHHLRPVYRALSLLAGLYVLIFGVVGAIATQGEPFYAAGEATSLGLKTNPAFSYLSVAAGAVIVLATLIGRNVDRIAYLWVGTGFLVAGTAMMLLMGDAQTNYLNFTMVTCVVSYVIGSVLGTAGMYVKSRRA